MRDDVAANWFLGVGGEHGCGAVHLRHDLICYHDSDAKLHIISNCTSGRLTVAQIENKRV